MKKWILFVLCFLLLLSVVVSALELPASIQKIIDYNNQQAAYYLENITYIVAFLAGLLAILSPCTLAIVPMYFSYGLKEKSTWHTFTFFLGGVFFFFFFFCRIIFDSFWSYADCWKRIFFSSYKSL